MTFDQIHGLISFIGIVMQLEGTFLLLALFVVLHRQSRRRRYFVVWGWAWSALATGLAALALRQSADSLLGSPLPPWAALALDFVHVWARLLFCGLILAGALLYSTTVKLRLGRLLGPLVVASGAYAAICVSGGGGVEAHLLRYSPVAVATFVVAALRLLGVPGSRRSFGTRATGTVLAAVALTWVVYVGGVTSGAGLDATSQDLLSQIVHYKFYVDVMLQMLLGYSMVVLLTEDAQREVDDARARLEVAHDRLRRESYIDVVTGVLNRRAFADGVGLEMAKANYGSVVVLDMDSLKEINDELGHAVGDAVLRHLAEALRGSLRTTDGLYRWGGDEFLLVLPGARTSEALKRVALCLADVEKAEIAGGPRGLRWTVSTGAGSYSGAEDLAEAIAHADREMYRHKKEHRTAPRALRVPEAVEPLELSPASARRRG